uniref:Uncharacterized protein n=1 Tax=Austropuccinia psidii TaxID=181123 RepID=A0A513X040_9BASI|nr:hypothetical protein [Austropuccinia psidii]QDH07303.1 hypothetical protein [Austropuccinia psidii]
MDVSSHTSWLSLETIRPYYYSNSHPWVGYVIRNLNLHFGLFPSRHTTLSSYVWNYHLKQYFSELNSHRYTSLCPIILLEHRSFITYPALPFYTWCIVSTRLSLPKNYPVWIFTVLVLFLISPAPPLPDAWRC